MEKTQRRRRKRARTHQTTTATGKTRTKSHDDIHPRNGNVTDAGHPQATSTPTQHTRHETNLLGDHRQGRYGRPHRTVPRHPATLSTDWSANNCHNRIPLHQCGCTQRDPSRRPHVQARTTHQQDGQTEGWCILWRGNLHRSQP